VSVKFVYDMAARNAADGICAFFQGHSWSDSLGAEYSARAITVSKWRRGELKLSPPELLKIFKALAGVATLYADGTDIYAYEASYVVWAVAFVERLLTLPPGGEE
jgi:hypothetical protein